MKMEYKILDNGTAVVLTRQPELVYDELYIDFSGAPSGATAIFEVGGDSLYRSLDGAFCGTWHNPASDSLGFYQPNLWLLNAECDNLNLSLLVEKATANTPKSSYTSLKTKSHLAQYLSNNWESVSRSYS